MTGEHLTLDAADLLMAMSGVAYIVDRSGIVIAVGGIDWFRLAEPGSSAHLAPERYVGRSLFDAMSGNALRQLARRVHDRVLQGDAQQLDYPYRCDAPDCARFCRMNMTPIPGSNGVMGVLYHSRIIEAYSRPQMGLFDSKARSHNSAGRLDVICSYCQKVVWPTGASEPDRTWIEADEFYRRGGSDDTAVSHGICPTCLDMLLGSAKPAAKTYPSG